MAARRVRSPYAERRALLAELAIDGPSRRTPRSFAADEGPVPLEATRQRELEGVVVKRLDAPYLPGCAARRGSNTSIAGARTCS